MRFIAHEAQSGGELVWSEGWIWTPDPPTSASQELRLQKHATMHRCEELVFLKINKMDRTSAKLLTMSWLKFPPHARVLNIFSLAHRAVLEAQEPVWNEVSTKTGHEEKGSGDYRFWLSFLLPFRSWSTTASTASTTCSCHHSHSPGHSCHNGSKIPRIIIQNTISFFFSIR